MLFLLVGGSAAYQQLPGPEGYQRTRGRYENFLSLKQECCSDEEHDAV